MTLSLMDQFWVWLSGIDGIGPKRFYQLLSIYEDPRTVWDNVGDENMRFLGSSVLKRLREARNEQYFNNLFENLEEKNIRVITRLNDAYPELLNRIYDPPVTLYVRGNTDLTDDKTIAVIGSRRCTRDGSRAAREFSETLVREGVTVVSGLARGIDTAAHEGALIGMGKTIAVLGCGVDVIYPPENERLYERIIENGGTVISEYKPGVQPLPGNFPARNRIISGLSQGTLIVEGAQKSGAMITVNTALDQGREVFAVPGSIYASLSAAPNKLIMEGANPVLSGWDILEHFQWAQRPDSRIEAPRPKVELDEFDDQIVKPLLEQELSFDELANIVDFPISKLNSHLTMLELRGIIVKVPGGLYRAYM